MVPATPAAALKQPHGLSPRIRRLRDHYFEGVHRPWNNEFTCWTTGTPWDVVYDETSYYIVPETYAFFAPFRASALQSARPVALHPDFWLWSLVERRAWLIHEVMVDCVPQELLPGDLLAGGRFNVLVSRCWNRREARAWKRAIEGRRGARAAALKFHEHGYGNAGATSGHLIPDHERALRIGWKGIYEDLARRYESYSLRERRSERGAQLRAMMTAATMPRDVAAKYSSLCARAAALEPDLQRRAELEQMAANLKRVPWEPATDFWEALQALWLNHMLIMSDENYPGPGVSFGRFDQYLLPYWRQSCRQGMARDFGKELLECFWVHANTDYDAMIRVGGNQGITSGFGQLITLSGMGANGSDMVFGGAGADRIDTGNADDVAWAGSGDDAVGGGYGPDELHGGSGDDMVRGGPGDDRVWAGPGRDVVRGGAGNDVLHALAADGDPDVLDCGRGRDTAKVRGSERSTIGPKLRERIDARFHDRDACEAAGLEPDTVRRLWQAFLADDPGIYWSRTWSLFALLDWCARERMSL